MAAFLYFNQNVWQGVDASFASDSAVSLEPALFQTDLDENPLNANSKEESP